MFDRIKEVKKHRKMVVQKVPNFSNMRKMWNWILS